MRNKYFLKVGVFLLAFITIGLIMQKNVSAQIFPFFSPFPTLGFPLRTGYVVTGGGAATVDGIWSGIWLSLVKFDGGILELVLITDPITGLITGTAALVGSKLIPIPINVTGSFLLGSTTTFELTGSYLDILTGDLYTLTITANILTTGVIDGTFSIISLKSVDYGRFYATLVI
ncbi:MAG: hypothetical protein ACMUJM_10890 [bacterium]